MSSIELTKGAHGWNVRTNPNSVWLLGEIKKTMTGHYRFVVDPLYHTQPWDATTLRDIAKELNRLNEKDNHDT